jgi:hypothetical protein
MGMHGIDDLSCTQDPPPSFLVCHTPFCCRAAAMSLAVAKEQRTPIAACIRHAISVKAHHAINLS